MEYSELLSVCGPKAAAATMYLIKTEGTVGVLPSVELPVGLKAELR